VEGKFPYSDNMRNARKFEFEVNIENTLDGYSGAQMDSFGQTSLKLKISCKCTFKLTFIQQAKNQLSASSCLIINIIKWVSDGLEYS
jgi:hypothetical protein